MRCAFGYPNGMSLTDLNVASGSKGSGAATVKNPAGLAGFKFQ